MSLLPRPRLGQPECGAVPYLSAKPGSARFAILRGLILAFRFGGNGPLGLEPGQRGAVRTRPGAASATRLFATPFLLSIHIVA